MTVLAHASQLLYQADRNELFLDHIDTEFMEWKFIVLYYAALQLGDAFIANKMKKNDITFPSHKKRKETYLKYFNPEAYKSYMKLEGYSRTARYHPEGIYTLTEKLFEGALNIDFPRIKGLC